MSGSPPKVSIIMSVYNDSTYIRESIDSILSQTFEDFEYIIIDDASSDDTDDIIRSYDDSRIKLIVNDANRGLTVNLNTALGLAQGKYIARMDGDDISYPDRIAKQVKYLDDHKDVYLIGTGVRSIGASDLVWRLPDNSEELKVRMLLRPVFAHPSFMFRHELIDEGYLYDETYRTAQDYDFAYRVSGTHKIGRVQDVLLKYRVHDAQVSNKTSGEQMSNADRVRMVQQTALGIEMDDEQQQVFNQWVREERPGSIDSFKKAYGLIKLFVSANAEYAVSDPNNKSLYDPIILEKTLKKMLFTWMIRSKRISYNIRFPAICDYRFGDCILFFGEVNRTLREKIQKRFIR